MFGAICMFFLTFFAATIYAAVILIQIGGWLSIAAGLLLLCSFILTGAAGLLGVSIAENAANKLKKEVKKE